MFGWSLEYGSATETGNTTSKCHYVESSEYPVQSRLDMDSSIDQFWVPVGLWHSRTDTTMTGRGVHVHNHSWISRTLASGADALMPYPTKPFIHLAERALKPPDEVCSAWQVSLTDKNSAQVLFFSLELPKSPPYIAQFSKLPPLRD
jgi:hypothetical protein